MTERRDDEVRKEVIMNEGKRCLKICFTVKNDVILSLFLCVYVNERIFFE